MNIPKALTHNFPKQLKFHRKSYILIYGDFIMNKKAVRIISLIIFAVAMTALTFIAINFIKSIKDPAEFKARIESYGSLSYALMMFIQISQVIVALIPGEFIEFLAGTLYGWLGGLIFCLAGVAIGQAAIFKAVRFFGKDFVENAAGSKAMGKFKFLKDEKKLKRIIFLLFLIPGTPKDLLTYAVPLTKISLKNFLLITLFARIPSVVSSTYAGSKYGNSEYQAMVIAYGIILIITLIGMGFYRIYETKSIKNKQTEVEEDGTEKREIQTL